MVNKIDDPTPPQPGEDSPKVPKPRVLVQKPQPPQATGMREKLCATCGRPFQMTVEQKFFQCPACYRKAHPVRKPAPREGAQVLIQIRCVACGTSEFLDFVPPDPAQALCRSCFSAQRKREPRPAREPKPRTMHKRSR